MRDAPMLGFTGHASRLDGMISTRRRLRADGDQSEHDPRDS